jgi:hypothetical protein
MENNGKRMPPPLIQYTIVTKKKHEYSYNDIINNDIDPSTIRYIVITRNDIGKDMTKVINLLSLSPDIELKIMDFESVVYFDSQLKEKISNNICLIDDSMRIDRSYIDLTKLKNIALTIPLTYLMWGVKFNDTVKTYCFLLKNDAADYLVSGSNNGNKQISSEDLIKIRNKVIELSKLCGDKDIDKVYLISDYIQSCTQFIAGRISESSNGTFVTPGFPDSCYYWSKCSAVETVLNEHHGKCMGIANLSTLLLNNEIMNVEVESVYGSSHTWNKVLIDGKYYYFDNTWCITRSEHVSDEGLITLDFTNKYLLFGNKTAMSIGHHNPEIAFVYDGVMSEDDFDHSNYNYESKFTYNKHPIYHSERMH